MDNVGIDKNMPIKPNVLPPANIENIITTGWSPSIFPMSLGVNIYPSKSWPTANTKNI